MMKQQLAHTLKMSSVLLRTRTALTGTTDKSCLSTLPSYAYERKDRKTAGNSTYPKGGDSCSKDSFMVNETLVFQIKFCGKSPALRVAAKRWQQV